MKRLFIAINLPDDVKEKIENIVSDLKISVSRQTGRRPPAIGFAAGERRAGKSAAEIRFLPKENWHLTLTFLGYQPDEATAPILKSIKETANKHSNILENVGISFEGVILAPPGKPSRMIWLAGAQETSRNLAKIKNYLDDSLMKNGVRFKVENREYNCHLTLARFRSPLINADIKRINAGIINVNRQINQHKSALDFQVQSLDLMESHLKRAGAEYEVLASAQFK